MTQKMMRLVGLMGFIALNLGGAAWAHEVPAAKAAELALHRVERLVILRKIEEPFQSKFKNLRLEPIAHQNEDEPSFKATVFQYPGVDGTQKSLEIIMNAEGKALSHAVKAGADASGAPSWPDKDPVTLSENALHYVIENAINKPELVPFNERLSGFAITEGTNAAGDRIGLVSMSATDSGQILNVRVKLDGTFDSAELVPAPTGTQ